MESSCQGQPCFLSNKTQQWVHLWQMPFFCHLLFDCMCNLIMYAYIYLYIFVYICIHKYHLLCFILQQLCSRAKRITMSTTGPSWPSSLLKDEALIEVYVPYSNSVVHPHSIDTYRYYYTSNSGWSRIRVFICENSVVAGRSVCLFHLLQSPQWRSPS